jgi:hypothetical protein
VFDTCTCKGACFCELLHSPSIPNILYQRWGTACFVTEGCQKLPRGADEKESGHTAFWRDTGSYTAASGKVAQHATHRGYSVAQLLCPQEIRGKSVMRQCSSQTNAGVSAGALRPRQLSSQTNAGVSAGPSDQGCFPCVCGCKVGYLRHAKCCDNVWLL